MWQKLVPLLLNWLFGQVVKPGLNYLLEKAKTMIQKSKIKKKAKKLEKAKTESEFNDSFDDLP